MPVMMERSSSFDLLTGEVIYCPVSKYLVHMEIKITEMEADKVRIIFVGETHTFMNALTDEILKDPQVDVARYRAPFHFADPELLVTTLEGRDPIEAIKDAAKRFSGFCDEVLGQIPEDA